MADSFGSSIAGFRDWLPYSGRRKGASTVARYTEYAARLASWARDQGHTGFAELTKADQ